MTRIIYRLIALFVVLTAQRPLLAAIEERPNIVVILADDLGYGDVNCFTPTRHKTSHLDRLAASGTKLTSFYVFQPVCTASLGCLLTGAKGTEIRPAGMAATP